MILSLLKVIKGNGNREPFARNHQNKASHADKSEGFYVAIAGTCISITIGLILLFSGVYIQAKALLAQYLIEKAWDETKQTGLMHTPWSWADTYPIAKLTIGHEESFVLSGVSGRSLAFGPGHMASTAAPGEPGNIVIAGHRDTHFSHLRNIQFGDMITLESQSKTQLYQVKNLEVVHYSDTRLITPTEDNKITLVTCYPIDGVNPNPQFRYIVQASQDSRQSSSIELTERVADTRLTYQL